MSCGSGLRSAPQGSVDDTELVVTDIDARRGPNGPAAGADVPFDLAER